MIDSAAWLAILLKIFFIDLLLGADNAVVMALASSKLPPREARQAMALGVVGAITLRLGMLLFANALLDVPVVKLVAAWTLIVIALNVSARSAEEPAPPIESEGSAGDLLAVAAVIMLADAAMSLDNVVALAALAVGSFWVLALGVLLSIPILAFGSLILSEIMRRAPEILTVGVIVLGWIAGEIAVSDPLIAGWIKTNAPALAALAPAFTAAFVWIAGGGAQSARRAQAQPGAILTESRSPAAPAFLPPPAVDPWLAQRLAGERGADEQPGPVGAGGRLRRLSAGGWSEERVVVLGFFVLAALAGLIIFIASILDSFT